MADSIKEHVLCEKCFQDKKDKRFKYIKNGALLFSLTGVLCLIGMSSAAKTARRQEPGFFKHGVNRGEFWFAVKALSIGTVCAVSGTGVLMYAVKTMMGVNSWKEFGTSTENFVKKLKIPEPQIRKQPAEKDIFSLMIEESFREKQKTKLEHTCGIKSNS